jgi:shikimate dehydrogenase
LTDRYAVIGQPIAHSLSPRIHSLFAQQVGAKTCYEAVEISPDRLAVMLPRLHAEHYLGLNVTLPHKTAVAALCEACSERAEAAGAVNTLIRTPTGWRGDNTDGEGLIRDLARLGVAVQGKRVLILGAGGAARGIIPPLLAQKPLELVISNRTPWKPEELVKIFHTRGPIRAGTHLALKGDRFDLIINATSAGHKGEMPRLPEGLFAAGATAYDLSYGKASEPFTAWARGCGITAVADGLGMLIEQAAAAFALWRNQTPDTTAVLRALNMKA